MAKNLLVRANPYLALDSEGRPAGMCPGFPGSGVRFIGAKLDKAACKVVRQVDTKKRERGMQEDRGLFVFAFDSGDIELPSSGQEGNYYRERLTHGDLIPANEATARACGRKFRNPDEVIAEARATAIAKFRAETGEEPLCAVDSTTTKATSDKDKHSSDSDETGSV